MSHWQASAPSSAVRSLRCCRENWLPLRSLLASHKELQDDDQQGERGTLHLARGL